MRVTVIEQIPTIQPHGRRSAPWEGCEEETAHWLSVSSRVTGSAVFALLHTFISLGILEMAAFHRSMRGKQAEIMHTIGCTLRAVGCTRTLK